MNRVKRLSTTLANGDDSKLVAGLRPGSIKPKIGGESQWVIEGSSASTCELTPSRKEVFSLVLSEMNRHRNSVVDDGDKRPILRADSNEEDGVHEPVEITETEGLQTSLSEDSGFQLDTPESLLPDPDDATDAPATLEEVAVPELPQETPAEKKAADGTNEDALTELRQQKVEVLRKSTVSSTSERRNSHVKELQEQLKPVIDPALLRMHNREYNKGPDQILPADGYVTIEAHGAVKLRIGERGMASISPLSIPTLLQRTAARHMNHPALCVKRNGQWVRWTYKQYLHDVQVCAKALIRLGLERCHSVCILGFNSPEWLITYMAAIHAGGIAVGIYTTNTAESCLYCAVHSQADIIVVEDRKQLEKILEVKHRIPSLKAIVQYTGKPHAEGVISWSQLMNLGNAAADNLLEDRLKKVAVNQCATIIYTSGTTGVPKGAMLSHDNLTWDSHSLATAMKILDGKEVVVSYLPLSHVAAQITDIYLSLSAGGTVYFAQPDALKGSLIETLREVKPTRFLGVPRVWEKMYEKMLEVGKDVRGLKRSIATWAKKKGLAYNRRRMQGNNSKPWGFSLANALVYKKVRAALGFERCTTLISGAAPLSTEVLEYFASLNMPIMEAYGMSESTGPHCINLASAFRLGSIGKALPGSITKIDNPDKEGQGEILMGGRHVFMGYLHDPSNTAAALDDAGWLHSGDTGRVDQFGFIYITGRIKELLITAGGENVAPVLIEDNIKAELPCVSHAMVVGDRRKFLSVLLTLKAEMDGETQEPLPTLSVLSRDWCEQAGLKLALVVADVLDAAQRYRSIAETNNETKSDSPNTDADCLRFGRAVQAAIDRANARATSNAQRVQKWAFLPVDFSVHGGELVPAMKMKRPYILNKYADVVEQFYV